MRYQNGTFIHTSIFKLEIMRKDAAFRRPIMSKQVVSQATLQCSFGSNPSQFVVEPINRVMAEEMPAAVIQDHIGNANIMPFGLCASLLNPTVIAATAANHGRLTPMPCVPIVPAPWTPGAPNVTIAGIPCLDDKSTCMCTWQGIIKVVDPGEDTINIP